MNVKRESSSPSEGGPAKNTDARGYQLLRLAFMGWPTNRDFELGLIGKLVECGQD